MKIIVTGHGHFATGLKSTVDLLAGELSGIDYIDFSEEMSEADLLDSFPKTDNLVFFCDLLGGTPYKVAATLSTVHENIAVIAGGNIGALLDVCLQNDIPNFASADKLANQLIEASQMSLQQFKTGGHYQNAEEENEDGI